MFRFSPLPEPKCLTTKMPVIAARISVTKRELSIFSEGVDG